MTSLNPLQPIFFDLDDTLYDHTFSHTVATRAGMALDDGLAGASFEQYLSRASEILEAFHPSVVAGKLSVDVARVRRYEALADEFGGDRSLAPRQAEAHVATYRASERAVPGSAEVLRALRTEGFPLYIVSNSTRVEQEGKLARLGFNQFFDALILSGEHAFAKPDPRLFAVALATSGVDAANVSHVGDCLVNDVGGAHAAGLDAVWLNRRRLPLPQSAQRPLAVLHDFADPERAVATITGRMV